MGCEGAPLQKEDHPLPVQWNICYLIYAVILYIYLFKVIFIIITVSTVIMNEQWSVVYTMCFLAASEVYMLKILK